MVMTNDFPQPDDRLVVPPAPYGRRYTGLFGLTPEQIAGIGEPVNSLTQQIINEMTDIERNLPPAPAGKKWVLQELGGSLDLTEKMTISFTLVDDDER